MWKSTSLTSCSNSLISNWISCIKNKRGAVPRWRRNRMERPLSPPQIHQKIIWMLSNFHKTTSECWQRTPGTQKGSPISSKGGRIKYKRWKQRQKIEGSRPILGRESWRRSFHTVGKPLTGRSVGSFRLSEGNITKRKTKHRLCT